MKRYQFSIGCVALAQVHPGKPGTIAIDGDSIEVRDIAFSSTFRLIDLPDFIWWRIKRAFSLTRRTS